MSCPIPSAPSTSASMPATPNGHDEKAVLGAFIVPFSLYIYIYVSTKLLIELYDIHCSAQHAGIDYIYTSISHGQVMARENELLVQKLADMEKKLQHAQVQAQAQESAKKSNDLNNLLEKFSNRMNEMENMMKKQQEASVVATTPVTPAAKKKGDNGNNQSGTPASSATEECCDSSDGEDDEYITTPNGLAVP